MEKHEHVERWVNLRMTASEPPSEWPDAGVARKVLDRRIDEGPWPRVVWAAATASLCLMLAAQPASQAVAQRLWDFVALKRIQVLTADFDAHGVAASLFATEMQVHTDARPVSSIEEAARIAGFSPRLPRPGVFTGSPEYSVTGVGSARLRLDASAVRAVARQTGGPAGEVPDSWDGAVLEIRMGPIIIADYGGVLLLQSLPFQMTKPADFDLKVFYQIAFRAMGLSNSNAIAADLAMSPALLTFMPKEEGNLLHEFKTKSGTGMMVEEVYGPGRIVALWSGSDRLYALYPDTLKVNPDFVVSAANAVE
jgi:hypothetical protein